MTQSDKWKIKIKKEIGRYVQKHSAKKYVLFGISEGTQLAAHVLWEKVQEIVCIIDNNPIWQGKEIWGRCIFSPTQLVTKANENIVIVICGGFVYEKVQQLYSLGFKRKNILVIKQKCGFIEDKIEFFSAWGTYKKLRRRYRGELLLCPYAGTGDAYLTGMYLNEYIKKRKIDEYTILVLGNAFKRVLALFGFEKAEIISKNENEKLKKIIDYAGGQKLGIHYLMYWGLAHQNTYRLEGYKDVSFAEMFRLCTFKGFCTEKPQLPSFSNKKDHIEELIKKYALIPDKTIVLAPYANSFQNELDMAWWENLADELKNKRYQLYTNSSGDSEPAIKGTNPIFLSFMDLVPVLDICGYIIGVRSGLFDLLSTSKCKKIVIYQDFMTEERMHFFSLINMYHCSDCYEFKLNLTEMGKLELKHKIISALNT